MEFEGQGLKTRTIVRAKRFWGNLAAREKARSIAEGGLQSEELIERCHELRGAAVAAQGSDEGVDGGDGGGAGRGWVGEWFVCHRVQVTGRQMLIGNLRFVICNSQTQSQKLKRKRKNQLPHPCQQRARMGHPDCHVRHSVVVGSSSCGGGAYSAGFEGDGEICFQASRIGVRSSICLCRISAEVFICASRSLARTME